MSSKPPRKPNRQSPKGPNMNQIPGKTAGFWVLILLVLFLVYSTISQSQQTIYELTYSVFLEQVEAGRIMKVSKTGLDISGELNEKTTLTVKDGTDQVVDKFYTRLLSDDPELSQKVLTNNPNAVLIGERPKTSWWNHPLMFYLPFLLILLLWFFFLRQMQGGGNKAFSFGKSKAKMFNMDKPEITFEDVAGCDEAKYELQEIIDFLKDPSKFQKLGGKIPKGVLLMGPPGTGKTLLARAIAGEAGVPFFSISGSDFVEMFVGVGASRVRDLFDQGKKNAPCIIFIDEIDAVGRHRGAGLGGGHDEREQTLNQLLVEMDGFESNEGVILLAATNRPDVLDPALLRPGRFDRQIVVDMPDLSGREAILKVHMKKVLVGKDVSARKIAAGTPGLAGADLENLVNEAALLAARKNHDKVTMDDFHDAREKVMMGPERRSLILSDDDKRITAYHEAGHTILSAVCEHANATEKVTIIPRGQALGVTFTPPEKDQHHHSFEQMIDQICMALGGRVAEELFIGKIHTGAYADIKMVTQIARAMVTSYGMSEAVGLQSLEEGSEQVFLGREYGRRAHVSEKTQELVDSEVKRIIDEQLARARKLLEEHRTQMDTMAAALLERETLDREHIELIMKGQPLPESDGLVVDHSTGEEGGDAPPMEEPGHVQGPDDLEDGASNEPDDPREGA